MPELVGIARLAARGPLLAAKRRVEYFQLESRRLIGPCSSPRVPFDWTINPYRGCEYGCKYCYARYTHEFLELREPASFERMIYAKAFSSNDFREELRRVPRPDSIWIGTATDPYQPAERRFRITGRMLEVFATDSGRRLGLTTKSDLVARDADLLAAIARANVISVHMTITTLDEALARRLEPYAPRPALRLEAVRRLAEAGVGVCVQCAPVMPLINDSEEALEAVCAAAAEAGATSFHAFPLFLRQPTRDFFLEFIRRSFPHLHRRYRERFAHSAYLSGAYPETLRQRVRAVRGRHGMDRQATEPEPPEWPREPQLSLFADL